MLLREIIGITTAARNCIRNYVDRLRNSFEKCKQPNGLYRVLLLIEVAKKLSGQDLFQGEHRLKLPVILGIDWGNINRGLFNVHGEWDYEIVLNIARMMKVKKMDDIWWATEIDYGAIRSTLVHEYVHFLQRYTKSSHCVNPFRTKKDYMNRGHEQGAWAAGEAELIRHQLEPFNQQGENLAPYILSALRHRGFSDEFLRRLKTENPVAWKQVMKKAAQIAMKDMDKDDKLPWQNDKQLPEMAG